MSTIITGTDAWIGRVLTDALARTAGGRVVTVDEGPAKGIHTPASTNQVRRIVTAMGGDSSLKPRTGHGLPAADNAMTVLEPGADH